MKRKLEATETDTDSSSTYPVNTPSEADLHTEALRQAHTAFDSLLMETRLRDFHNPAKIQKVAASCHQKIVESLKRSVIGVSGPTPNIPEVVAKLDIEFPKRVEELLEFNEERKAMTTNLLKRVADFKINVWNKISADMKMGLEAAKKIMNTEKTEILSSFPRDAKRNSDFIALILELQRMEKKVMNAYHRKLEEEEAKAEAQEEGPPNPGPSGSQFASTSASSMDEEDKFFRQLENLILEKSEYIQRQSQSDDLEATTDRLEIWLWTFENRGFNKHHYRQSHARLVKVFKMAKEGLTYVPSEMFDQWKLAFDVDVKACFPSQRIQNDFKIDRRKLELTLLAELVDLKLKESEKLEEKVKTVLSPSPSSLRLQEKEMEILKIQEEEVKMEIRKLVRDEEDIQDLFMERMIRIWKAKKAASAVDTDAAEASGLDLDGIMD